MAETEGLWHFYVRERGPDDAGVSVYRACQLDDEMTALVIEGATPLVAEHGPWRDTPEEAIIALLEAQLEAEA